MQGTRFDSVTNMTLVQIVSHPECLPLQSKDVTVLQVSWCFSHCKANYFASLREEQFAPYSSLSFHSHLLL